MKNSHYIILDCETGGLDEASNPITQVACLVLDSVTLKELQRFETYVKPYNGLVITKEALAASLVTMADINNGLPIDKVVKVLSELFKMYSKPKGGTPILIGHNIGFDLKFLDYAFNLQSMNLYSFINRVSLDTMADAKRLWLTADNKDDKSVTLTNCCKRADIVLKDAHGAMNDVVATTKLWLWFTERMRGGSVEVKEGEAEVKQKSREFFEM